MQTLAVFPPPGFLAGPVISIMRVNQFAPFTTEGEWIL
jgi:hypothetical protein